MATVTALSSGLERQLNNNVSFKAINTRVLLRTGVNMAKPKPTQDSDQVVVEKVRTALAEMGYRF